MRVQTEVLNSETLKTSVEYGDDVANVYYNFENDTEVWQFHEPILGEVFPIAQTREGIGTSPSGALRIGRVAKQVAPLQD